MLILHLLYFSFGIYCSSSVNGSPQSYYCNILSHRDRAEVYKMLVFIDPAAVLGGHGMYSTAYIVFPILKMEEVNCTILKRPK